MKTFPGLNKKRLATAAEASNIQMCPMENCWQPSRNQGVVGGLCSACGGWWSRVQLLKGPELQHYLRKAKRMAGRIGIFSKESRTKKVG